MKIKAMLCGAIFFLTTLTGCGADNSASENKILENVSENFCSVTDDAGREVKLSEKPKRVAVVSASFLEPFHAVGGEVVGRPTSKTKVPDFAKDAAEIGAVYQIDAEKLLACQPDFVIINKGMNEKLADILNQNKIPFVIVDMKSYEEVKKNILMFSEITGQPDKGKKIVEEMDQKIKAVAEKIPAEKKRVAILHSTAQGLSVQLDGSIAGNVVKILGWENTASEMQSENENEDSAPYSLETLIEQNPEIIFVTSMGNLEEIKKSMEKMLSENAAFQTIPAVKNNQVYYLPQEMFLFSPGINYPEAVEYAAKLIYPEMFK